MGDYGSLVYPMDHVKCKSTVLYKRYKINLNWYLYYYIRPYFKTYHNNIDLGYNSFK